MRVVTGRLVACEAIACVALVACPDVLAAQKLEDMTVGQLMATIEPKAMADALKAICIDHLGDAEAQAREATSLRWGFVPTEDNAPGERRFIKWPARLTVKAQSCTVSSAVNTSTTQKLAARDIASVLNLGELTDRKEPVSWTTNFGGRQARVFWSLIKLPGQTRAYLAVYTEKARR